MFYLSKDSGPSDATKAVQSAYRIPTRTFRTEFFEMETPESWEFQPKTSKPNMWVYYNFRHKLARGMIFVYVNKDPVPQHKQASRLLPVKLGYDDKLVPDSVTDHCNKTAPGKDKVGEQAVTLVGIPFVCDNDTTLFTVLVALKSGTPNMEIKRPDGSTATYTIYYQDSSAYPTAPDFIEVIRRFKVN